MYITNCLSNIKSLVQIKFKLIFLTTATKAFTDFLQTLLHLFSFVKCILNEEMYSDRGIFIQELSRNENTLEKI